MRDGFDDDFSGPELRRDVWIDHYLPQWTTPDRSRARWALGHEGLELRIEEGQPDWRPEDGFRVSSLQTGTYSEAVGSPRGTHRHRPDGLRVRTDTGTRLLWTPSAGEVRVTVRASRDPDCVLAAWLVGTEHRSPAESGEICLFEIDFDAIGTERSTARTGIKAHGDPRLRTDMREVEIPVDASEPHTWVATWGPGGTTIACEERVVFASTQAPDYPLILLVDLFEVGGRRGPYPKTAIVRRVRGRTARSDGTADAPER